MNITEQAEINFHQQTQISIYLESTASADEEKLAEVAFFAMYAIRMLSNLGANETSNSLASLLVDGHQVVQALATGEGPRGFDLIPYPGNQGRKRFFATLTLTDSSVRFDLKAKGFGFLATGVGYYGPTSVVALLRHLALQRSKDAVFLRSLGGAAEQCGQAHLGGYIKVTNHVEIFGVILATNCGPFVAQEKSNEISEWDRITSEADSRVCAILKTFVSSRLQDYPTCEEMFLQGRDFLYAYFCGASNYISRQLDGDLARYKESLLRLNASSYLKLLSALNMLHVVGRYLANSNSQREEVWFNLVSEGICKIYDQPDEYLRGWYESLEYLADAERGAFRLSFRTYDEIAPLLALRPNDTVEMMSWPPIINECVTALSAHLVLNISEFFGGLNCVIGRRRSWGCRGVGGCGGAGVLVPW